MNSSTKFLFVSLLLLFGNASLAQDMSFEEYNPPSTLKVPEHPVKRAKFPFVDIHSHQGGVDEKKIDQLISEMDEINMGVMVNLSGRGFGRGDSNTQQEYIKGMIKEFNTHAPGRFMVFTNLNFAGFGDENWSRIAVKELEEDVAAGASGLKIYKSLGLNVTDVTGKRVPVNHPDLDAVWAKAGELGIPVIIHSADPAQFWQPVDENNERWLELKINPNRKRGADNPAPFEQIMAEQHDIFAKHPETTFINAHMGWMANDLDAASAHLEKYPNVNFGIGAVIAEFGRQPRRAKEFFEKYQDRVLFGKDAYNKEEFYTYFRVLETEDEYFPYYKKYHAFWSMYGLGLSDEVLKKLYYKNALRIVPGMDKTLFPD
ncbi:amidohydrolase family protein [Algoriphagus antarcticus]|uniref:Putative TIM-barrel fold metal-dependent hydrolase n=1 Tax=Algoriphagus antarcticus TaxID=238540 RepID=A0A3E0DN75_9BACT|nr:amidohydrolase family protein [Algoriphagus antarcticus]REG83615.1 putative TIM-barrel fold metal-dependent hydrolase [Algoriphagus antarcticus]